MHGCLLQIPGEMFAQRHCSMRFLLSALSAQNAMPQGAWEKNSPTFTTLAPHDAGATHKRSSREISQDARTSCSSGSTDGKSPGSALLKLYHLRACPRPTTDFAVLKLSNIAWNLSIADVVAYFAPISVPVAHLPPHYTQGVHIIMNRSTGKTQGDCFIEFPTFTDAQRALELHARGILKGRVVIAQWSTQSELMDALFPYRQTISGRTELRQPNADHATNQLTRVVQYVPAGSGLVYGPSYPTSSREGIFLLRDEIDALLLVCRNYKLHFSRKCAERPFENIISILSKVSWHDPECLSVSHRDHLFEMLKLSLESLKIHKSRSDHHIDETLMERMVRAGLCVPLFTERQKLTLVTVARMDVPPDLSIFVYNPPDDTSSLGRQDGDTCQASTMGVATTHVDLDQDVGHAASIKAPQCVIEQNCPTTGTVPWREQAGVPVVHIRVA
ncbi:hypothetical protein BC832DRAFT_315172 [Gaertneriomyces semiglobifer]|nr:hypothetical protein BC832DRAFT_315172 [Gaertneriomyces semiglobifer]